MYNDTWRSTMCSGHTKKSISGKEEGVTGVLMEGIKYLVFGLMTTLCWWEFSDVLHGVLFFFSSFILLL